MPLAFIGSEDFKDYFAFLSFDYAYMNPLLLLFFLLDRESVDGEECKKKHGEAWDRYCHRVKYRLIPYVWISKFLLK
jgi:protein-S-isoprenylcysteine O-methyltransferase Ste14